MSAEESSKKEKPVTPVATPKVKPCNPQMETNNVHTIIMKKKTEERFEVISFIINKIGDKGRDIKISHLNDLVEKEFPNKFKDEREFNLYFNSQVRLLVEDYELAKINKSIIGLTDRGIDVYELKDGFYEFLVQRKNAIKEQRLSSKMSIASSIATVLAMLLSACTFWLTYYNYPMKTNLIILGISCFILGFVLRGLTTTLLKHLWKYRE